MNVVQNKKKQQRKGQAEFKQNINFNLHDDANPDKIINRQVLNEINSTTNNQSNSRESSSLILSLTEGRGQARGEIGLASIDLESPVLILCQLSDGVYYTDAINKIQVLNPSKILVPDTIFETVPLPKIIEIIRENFSNIMIIPVQRRHFNDKTGLQQISNLCSRKSFNILQVIARKYYCLSAASALLTYLKNVNLVSFAEKCLKIEYQTKGGMMIDTQTSTRLELLYTLNVDVNAAKKFSLFTLLNKCETRIGQRHLRANILEPSCDINFIERRHAQIKVFMKNEALQTEIKENLQKFRNVETLLKISCITSMNDQRQALQTNIHLAILLKNVLEAVKPLALIVSNMASEHFEEARQLLSSPIFGEIIAKIDQIIQPNIHENRLTQKHFQYLYAVRAGFHETIDFLRHIYTETVDKIREYIASITQTSALPIKMLFTCKLGYHLLLKNSILTKFPTNFELICRKGQNAYLTTAALIVFNDKIHLIENDLLRISNSVLCDMLRDVAKEIDIIYLLIGVVIELDIVQSLAEVAMAEDSYCCPKFSRVLRLEDAYHPILQSAHSKVELVKNNVIATPQYNFYLITGPNMSGKTIYIKMIAIIQIMAQIGSFIPAKSATLRLSDKIFSRLGFQDNIEQNASSFTVELRDMEYIYSNLTPNSLVIIDELCRSTDPQEGEVLCYAFCEKLLNFIGVSNDDYFKMSNDAAAAAVVADDNYDDDEGKDQTIRARFRNSSSLVIKGGDIKLKDIARPFVFLTTHFTELSKLTDSFNNAVNLHMLVNQKSIDNKMRLEFKYKIQSGPSTLKSYGLALANMIRFPSSLVDRAEELISEISDESIVSFIKNNAKKLGNNREETTLNETTNNSIENVSNEISELEKDVIDLYSYVLLLMSTENNERCNYINIDVINQKIRQLIEAMTPNLRELLKESSLEEIIGILNYSKNSENSIKKMKCQNNKVRSYTRNNARQEIKKQADIDLIEVAEVEEKTVLEMEFSKDVDKPKKRGRKPKKIKKTAIKEIEDESTVDLATTCNEIKETNFRVAKINHIITFDPKLTQNFMQKNKN